MDFAEGSGETLLKGFKEVEKLVNGLEDIVKEGELYTFSTTFMKEGDYVKVYAMILKEGTLDLED